MHVCSKRLVAALLLVFAVAAIGSAESLRFVSSDDQVYEFLEYARTAGRLDYLPRVRPFTERDVVRMLNEVLASAGSAVEGREWISTRSREHLARIAAPDSTVLAGEFGEDGSVTIDAAVVLKTEAALNRLRDTIPTLLFPASLSIDLADELHMSLDGLPSVTYWAWYEEPYPRYERQLLSDYYVYTHVFAEDDGGFNHGGRHTPGEPSLRIMVDTKNQFSVDMDYLQVHLGRQALGWGPAGEANLILSETAKPYDYFGFSMPLGGVGNFSWITAMLQDFAFGGGELEERFLTAHRLGYQITDWLYLAVYESVVYDLSFELAYLNPLSFYYVTEVTQGSDDNKLGGADFVVSLPQVEVYGSFFGDDWDAGRMWALNSSHNIWAGILGARTAGLITPGLTLNLELAYLSHWMYTHFTWQSLTSVGRSYQHYGTPIGHYLGPNSWMAYLSGRYDLSADSWLSTAVRLVQDGRGDINTPANWSAESALHGVDNYRDIYYSFLDRGKPGFEIETTVDWTVAGRYLLPDTGLTFEAAYTVQYSVSQATEDMSMIPGSREWGSYLDLSIGWTPGTLSGIR